MAPGTADEPSRTDVLIIGAGPAGLFAASELLRYGVKPRIVEQRSAPHHETRGTGLQPAVLEVLHRAGVIAPFLADSAHIKEVELLGPGQTRLGLVQFSGLGCKYEFQCSQPQWRTESVLRDHLAGQGLQVEYGVEATSIAADGAGVTVTLARNGREELVRADYLIGAGGGHSVTRHSMEEHLDGETYGGRYIVADVKLTLPAAPGRARIIVGPGGFVLLALLPESRFLIFVNRDEADQSDGLPSAADLAALLNARVGADVGLSDLRWVSYFQMHKRVVPALSDGRRFLLGDAGHLSSPMGGEGINSALMDGANLAWKLALVLRGAAKPSLLDSYAFERGLADRHVLEVSNEIHGSVMQLVETCRAGEPLSLPAQAPAEALAGLRKRSMLDVSYKGGLLIERGSATPSPRPARAFRAGAISTEPPTTWLFPAARRRSTILGRDGAASCPSWTGRTRTFSRNRPGWRMGALFWSARMVSSVSGAPRPMKMRSRRSTRISRPISIPTSPPRWTDQVHRSEAAVGAGLNPV